LKMAIVGWDRCRGEMATRVPWSEGGKILKAWQSTDIFLRFTMRNGQYLLLD
jgi:hypothetical protein